MTGFAQLWESIRKKGTKEGFTEIELQDLIKPLLKSQLNMSKEQIWYMFNKEKKALTNKEAYDMRRINLPNAAKKEPEQTYTPHPEVVAAKLKLLETEAEGDNTSVKSQGANAFDYKAQPEPEEDPQALEIQFLKEKVIELEEALHKTQQFVPATQLPINEQHDTGMTDDIVFQYLRDRATQTGDIIFIDRVGSGALAQVLHQYKGSFGVAELYLRVLP